MKKHFYGGQAVIEGVMIRGKSNCVVAVRNSQNKIILNQIPIPSFSKPFFKKIPFLRGVIILIFLFWKKYFHIFLALYF